MKSLSNPQIASRGHAMKQAMQTINRTVAICDGQRIFSDDRRAELQACAVIISRAIDDIWKKYDSKI